MTTDIASKETVLHLHKTIKEEREVRIKLSKMSKGYQWEISTEGPDPDAVISHLRDTDAKLRQYFATEGESS